MVNKLKMRKRCTMITKYLRNYGARKSNNSRSMSAFFNQMPFPQRLQCVPYSFLPNFYLRPEIIIFILILYLLIHQVKLKQQTTHSFSRKPQTKQNSRIKYLIITHTYWSNPTADLRNCFELGFSQSHGSCCSTRRKKKIED